MKTQIIIIFTLGLLGLALGTYNPLSRFPPSPDWTNTTVFNQPILNWVYTHLALIKYSGYNEVPGSLQNIYVGIFGGSARASNVLWDCIYDAYVASSKQSWKTVSGVYYKINGKYTNKQINQALAYAAYTALIYNFGFLGSYFVGQINQTLVNQGYDLSQINNNSTATPSGVGVLACQNVINNYYAVDGTNYRGDNPLSVTPGYPFSDYTNFVPVNDPMPTIGHTDCDTVRYIDSWQQARVQAGNGSIVLGWGDQTVANMKPLIMPCQNSFRPAPPPKNITATRAAWNQRNEVLLNRSASLGDFQKCIAQFWQDGEGFSGTQWTRITATASNILNYQLKYTVKFNWLINHAMMEGYIVQYEGKRYYNPPRPTTPMQCYYRNQKVQSWIGPYQGVGTINGSNWTAYLPITFVQNPTPEYPCGHCTQSGSVGAAFQAWFNGNDTFVGYPRTYLPGTLPTEPKLVAGDPGYVAGLTDVPNKGPTSKGYAPAANVTLTWPTWTAISSQASLSRTYLGVHFDSSQQVSYANGRNVGNFVYNTIKSTWWKYDNSPDSNDSN